MPDDIRDAAEGDVSAVVDLFEEYHSKSRFRDKTTFDRVAVSAFCSRALEAPDFDFIVAENGGKIIGVLTAQAMMWPWSSGMKGIGGINLYVAEGHKGAAGARLLRELMRRARERGSGFLHADWVGGYREQEYEALLRALGFERSGGSATLFL